MKLFYLYVVPIIASIIVSINQAVPNNTVFLPTVIYPTETQTNVAMVTMFPTETRVPTMVQPSVTAVVENGQIVLVPTNTSTNVPLEFSTMEIVSTEELHSTETPQWMGHIGTLIPDFLTPPTSAPMLSIDHLWDSIATPSTVDFGLATCPEELPTPFITWQMAYELSLLDGDNSETIELPASAIAEIAGRGGAYFPNQGTVLRPENGLLSYMMSYFGSMRVCQFSDGKPNVYGPGIQYFLNDLALNYLY